MQPEPAWRRHLESLMLEAPPEDAERTAQLWRESRAAWLLLLPAPRSDRRLLLVGDARSGTAAGAARLGWSVTVLDPDPEHLAFAKARHRATLGEDLEVAARLQELTPGPLFDCVFVEDPSALPAEEAARLSRDLVAQTTDNTLAYKRSSGARADFHTTHPLAFLRSLLFERDGHLRAQRLRLGRACSQAARAAALYPDRRDFALVVDLDRPGPGLLIGPMERRNKLKLLGHALGLFPKLTPSLALWATKSETPLPRERFVDTLLAQLENKLGVAPGTHTPEHLVATRGNTALVTTSAGWVLRVPLSHRATLAAHLNARNLSRVSSGIPRATPLFEGEVEVSPAGESIPKVFVTLETRINGLGAGQLAQNPRATKWLLAQLAERLATLESRPPAPLTGANLDELFGARFAVVKQHCASPTTSRALDALETQVRHLAEGLTIGRVTSHRDLRPKHVIATPDGPSAGALQGLVDWSCLDPHGPPLYDLFHFIAQERASRPKQSARSAWLALQDRAHLEPHEVTAIQAYESALGLPPEWYDVIAHAYPVLFGAMAEEHWAFSRPRWLQRLFGIGDSDPE